MKKRIYTVLISLIFAGQFAIAQNMISGNVIRENKKPIPGVKVTIEGVNGVEALTDQLGNFDIEVPVTAKILIFSFQGMKTQKIGIGKKSYISVTMIEGKDEIPPPVVKKEEKPKTTSKETSNKNETDNTKVKSNTQKDSKGNKPKAIVTPDSTVKDSKAKDTKPKEAKKTETKDNNKDKSKSKDTKSSKDKKVDSDSVKVKEPAKSTTDTKKKK